MAFEARMLQLSEFTNHLLSGLVFNLVAFGLFGLPLAPVATQLGCTIEDTHPERRLLADFRLLVLGAVLFVFGQAQFQFFDLTVGAHLRIFLALIFGEAGAGIDGGGGGRAGRGGPGTSMMW